MTGQARGQATLFPEYLEDFIAEDNPVRIIDAFVEELDLRGLGFKRVDPAATGRPAYHPAVLLKLYIYYGYPTHGNLSSYHGRLVLEARGAGAALRRRPTSSSESPRGSILG